MKKNDWFPCIKDPQHHMQLFWLGVNVTNLIFKLFLVMIEYDIAYRVATCIIVLNEGIFIFRFY